MSVREQIEGALDLIERVERCVICLAIESGSRAWGFESIVPSGELRRAIDDLLVAKRSGAELDNGPGIPAIGKFIDTELARLENVGHEMPVADGDTARLDAFFQQVLANVWRPS